MATPRSRTLVLGGIRSGKSDLAELLAATAAGGGVRYLATARDDGSDADWSRRIAAHKERRPVQWTTVEVGEGPQTLIWALGAADPDHAVLVDDLGTWLAGAMEQVGARGEALHGLIGELAAGVAGCAAPVVLVSPEVGLSVVPATSLGRAFADALGTANRAVADACDAVVLVVAGQPLWIKGDDPRGRGCGVE